MLKFILNWNIADIVRDHRSRQSFDLLQNSGIRYPNYRLCHFEVNTWLSLNQWVEVQSGLMSSNPGPDYLEVTKGTALAGRLIRHNWEVSASPFAVDDRCSRFWRAPYARRHENSRWQVRKRNEKTFAFLTIYPKIHLEMPAVKYLVEFKTRGI
jgi:hypothetical protein